MSEEKKDERRWIMVSDGTPQSLFVGKTELSDEQIASLREQSRFIVLEDCRILRTLFIPNPGGGVVQQNQIVPHGICRGATKVRVMPVSYIRPDEDASTMEPLMKLITKCSEAELANRMKEAGLVDPKDAPPPGPPPSGDGLSRLGPGGRVGR